MDDGKLMDRQKQELLDQYENDLKKLQMQQEQSKLYKITISIPPTPPPFDTRMIPSGYRQTTSLGKAH